MRETPPVTRRAATAGLLIGLVSPGLAAPGLAQSAKKSGLPSSGELWNSLPPTPGLPRAIRTETASLGKSRLWFAEYGADGGAAGSDTPATEGSTATASSVAAPTTQSRDPVLFLHGGFGHSAHWGHQIADLARDRRVIATDTRGHGRSPMPAGELSFAAFARDVDALLTYLGIPTVAIVGWSDGAITAMQLAMTKPERVRRAVLFGANATTAGTIPGGSKLPTFATYAARCRADYARLSPTPERWGELSAGLSAMWRREPNYPPAALGRIGARTLVLAAEHDEIIRRDHAASIAKAIPGARFAELKGVSHFAMMQSPAAFTNATRGFLDGA